MDANIIERLRYSALVANIYYIAYAIFYTQYLITYTNFTSLFGLPIELVCSVMKIASMSLLIVKMLFQRYQLRFVPLYGILALIVLTSLYFTHDQQLIVILAFAATAQWVDIRKVAILCCIISLGIMVFTAASAALGVIASTTKVLETGKTASSLGFIVPNRLGATIFSTCFSLSVYHYPNIRVLDYLAYAAGFLLCAFVACSSTGCAAILISLVALLVFSYAGKQNKEKTLYTVCMIVFLLLLFAGLYFMVSFNENNVVHATLDRLLTGRLDLSNRYLNEFPITLFGRNFGALEFKIGNYTTLVVDNAYAKLFIQLGVIPAVAFLTCYLATYVRSLKRTSSSGILIYGLTVMACVAFSESYAFHFPINFCMLGLLTPLFRNDPNMKMPMRLAQESCPAQIHSIAQIDS